MFGVRLEITNGCVPHHVHKCGVASRMYPIMTGAWDTGWPMARHGQAANRIKEKDDSSARPYGHHTGREEVEDAGAGIRGEEEDQQRGMWNERGKVERREE